MRLAGAAVGLACACGSPTQPDGGGEGGACTTLAFEAWATFDDVREVYAMASADLDGDGTPDLVVAESSRDRVSIFLDRARDGGTFERRQLPAGRNPFALSVEDLDGDGRVEIYVGGEPDGGVYVLNHPAADAPPAPVYLPNLHSQAIDGLAAPRLGTAPVLLATSRTSTWFQATALGPDGGTTFLFGFDAGVAGGPGVTADFDGDGRDDAAMTVYFDGLALVTSGGARSVIAQATASSLDDLAAADLDGDGDLDLVQAAGVSLGAYLNDGHGVLTAAEVFDGGVQLVGVATADFDRDGRVDVAAVQGGAGDELDFFSFGDAGLVLRSKVGAELGLQNPQHVVAADFDLDGLPDVAVSDYGAANLRVFRNASTGCAHVTTPGSLHWRTTGCSTAGASGLGGVALLMWLLRRRNSRGGEAR